MKNLLFLFAVLLTLQLTAQPDPKFPPPPSTPVASTSPTASVSSSNKESKDKRMGSPASRLNAGKAKLIKKLNAGNPPNEGDPFAAFFEALDKASEFYESGDYASARPSLLKALSLADRSDREIVLIMAESLLDLSAELNDDEELLNKAGELISVYTKNNPDDHAFVFEIAYFAYEIDQYEASFYFFKRCIDAEFNVAESAYMAASNAALQNQGEVAVDWLRYSLEAGYLDILDEEDEDDDEDEEEEESYISTDDDLKSIRNLESYQKLKSKYDF